ncbi:MAG: hypothetical protein ABW209_06545, partial [Pseudomonas caspiana]
MISSADTDIAHDIDTHNRDKTEPNETVFMANLPERRMIRQLQKPCSEHPAKTNAFSGFKFLLLPSGSTGRYKSGGRSGNASIIIADMILGYGVFWKALLRRPWLYTVSRRTLDLWELPKAAM